MDNISGEWFVDLARLIMCCHQLRSCVVYNVWIIWSSEIPSYTDSDAPRPHKRTGCAKKKHAHVRGTSCTTLKSEDTLIGRLVLLFGYPSVGTPAAPLATDSRFVFKSSKNPAEVAELEEIWRRSDAFISAAECLPFGGDSISSESSELSVSELDVPGASLAELRSRELIFLISFEAI